MRLAALAVAWSLAACAGAESQPTATPPPPGIRLTVEGPVAGAPGHHLVMGELVLPPGAPVPRHRHSGEEFVTVLEGSVTLYRDGMADLVLNPGEGVRIAPGVPHSGIAGGQGLRAVSSWIVVDGQPLREALPE